MTTSGDLQLQHHQDALTMNAFMASFPWDLHGNMLPNQYEGFEIISRVAGSVTIEAPTGTGKTDIGYTALKALESAGLGPLFYIAPTKTIVEQVKTMHPDVTVVYGRNAHPCFYYPGHQLQADEIPCSLLVDCPHRVDQQTGETKEPGAEPCSYLLQKFQAKQSKIDVCTMAFYLFTQLFSREWDEPAGLVIDEAHDIGKVVRSALSYEITDYHLKSAIRLLRSAGIQEADLLDVFLGHMLEIIRRRAARTRVLLEDAEIRVLIEDLMKINPLELRNKIQQAVERGDIDVDAQREVLRRLEVIAYELNRYLRSLEFSLPTESRKPLNYTYGFYEEEAGGEDRRRVGYKLVIKAHYVAPIVRRILSSRFTLAYSATIGNPDVFGYETGIKSPAYKLGSDFPVANTRVFMPTDTPDLAVRNRTRQQPTRVIRQIARYCGRFAEKGLRSLVVVVSEKERAKFLELCKEEGVNAISYGNGVAPKEAALNFKAGQGDVLVGTVANYGEGVDLPRNLAPVIFFLRPNFPVPQDPATVFEERRYGSMRWKIWNWRVMMTALQVRGRNVRGTQDLGVTFFISQQFRRFVFAVLPAWLQVAFRGGKTFDQCIEEAEELLVKS